MGGAVFAERRDMQVVGRSDPVQFVVGPVAHPQTPWGWRRFEGWDDAALDGKIGMDL
jgi:hypothetical protein